MSKQTLFIATLFFLLSPWFLMGLGNAPEEPEKDVHVSEEVKIEQEQEQEQEQEEKQSEQAESAEKEEQEKARKEKSQAQTGQEAEPEKQAETGADEQPQDTDDSKKSAEEELQEMTLSDDESLIEDEERLYTRKDRVDPFEPFLNKGSESSGEEDDDTPEIPDTPLTRVALSQWKLTAVMRVPGENKSIAMVEDEAGKGYVIDKGRYVGEKGAKVAEILSDRIILREEYKDVYGKTAVREIEKKLQK